MTQVKNNKKKKRQKKEKIKQKKLETDTHIGKEEQKLGGVQGGRELNGGRRGRRADGWGGSGTRGGGLEQRGRGQGSRGEIKTGIINTLGGMR